MLLHFRLDRGSIRFSLPPLLRAPPLNPRKNHDFLEKKNVYSKKDMSDLRI